MRLVSRMPGWTTHVLYVLNEAGEAEPFEGELSEWAHRMETLGKERCLAETDLGELGRVTTVFLGMDNEAALMRPNTKPCIFGTLAWKCHQEFFDSTRAEALARHARVVEKMKARQSLRSEDE